MIPAAVSHTEMKMEMSWASLKGTEGREEGRKEGRKEERRETKTHQGEWKGMIIMRIFYRPLQHESSAGGFLTNLIEVEVLRMLRYWRMSGTVMSRRARRKRRPCGGARCGKGKKKRARG